MCVCVCVCMYARMNSFLFSDTSVIPPLIYAVMGTSRDIAIGPVAVVSLLMSSMVPKLEDPEANPIAYRNLVLTTTFFAGIFQAAFGLFRWFVNNCSFAG